MIELDDAALAEWTVLHRPGEATTGTEREHRVAEATARARAASERDSGARGSAARHANALAVMAAVFSGSTTSAVWAWTGSFCEDPVLLVADARRAQGEAEQTLTALLEEMEPSGGFFANLMRSPERSPRSVSVEDRAPAGSGLALRLDVLRSARAILGVPRTGGDVPVSAWAVRCGGLDVTLSLPGLSGPVARTVVPRAREALTGLRVAAG